jgi:ATP-dependent Clp protease ATP-binding subunit ClpA/protein subunit release factor A
MSDFPEFPEFLASFAEDLTARAGSGLGDVYEREAEVSQILQALASPLKGRVVVLGPARAGKTAAIHRAISRIASGECPPELRGKTARAFAPADIPGVATRGPWYNALDYLFTHWAQHPDLILYIDPLTRAARLGGSRNEDEGDLDVAEAIANFFKRHAGLCVVEAEETAWRRFVEAYPDYGQLFLPVRIDAPPPDVARAVVAHVSADLSLLHSITVTPEAQAQAFDLSQRYALDKAQPGKTIDLIRDALAVAAPGAGAQLTADNVIRRFGEQSGLPRMLLDDAVPFNEEETLRFFNSRVLGQDQAVEAVAQSLSLLRARVHNPLRPMGVFLFLGPTGVGKTELARTLAEYLYGTRDRLVRFNMADYPGPYEVNELFGNPYSSEISGRRGQLTNRLAGQMFSVIVLDEFEKAFAGAHQRFLQLFDEGLLINGNAEVVNLRNAIFILTSNFGARLIEHGRIGFAVNETAEAREKRVLSETEAYFTPEFMNRIDAVCIFHPLNRAVMADIARREIGDLLKREGLRRRQIETDLADEVIEQVVALGYSPHYGARYLKRQIEKTITYPLAREINAQAPGAVGGVIRLYLKQGRVTSIYLTPHAALPEAMARPASGLPSLDDLRAQLPVFTARVEALEERHGLPQAQALRAAILAEMADVSFWNDPVQARRKLDRYQQATSTVDMLSSVRQAHDHLAEQCAAAEPRLDLLARAYKLLAAELPRLEFTSFLSGPHDTAGAYVQITVNAKLTGARQWGLDLARMYLGWAKRRGLSATALSDDLSPEGRTATLMLAISGFGVYGLLRGESGAHRLVQTVKHNGKEVLQRLPAYVSVWPELDDDELPASGSVELKVKDAARPGLLIPRVTTQVIARQTNGERVFSLAGDLPGDDLAAEAERLLRASLAINIESSSELARSYYRNTKEKGVHDHRTRLRNPRFKQVLDGHELQTFLDAALQKQVGT